MLSRTKSVLVLTIFTILFLAGQAHAGDTWICSITDAVAYEEDGTIGPPDLSGLDQPTFIRIDPDRKQVTLLEPESRRGEISKIDTVHEGDGVWLFSGIENDRAWSIVISAGGHMTMSAVMDGAIWAVFGNAMLED